MNGYLVAYEVITDRNRICYEKVTAYNKHHAISIIEMRIPYAVIMAVVREDELD